MEAGRASDRHLVFAAFAVVLLVLVTTHYGGPADSLPRFIHVRVTRSGTSEGGGMEPESLPHPAALLFACNHKTGAQGYK